MSKSSLLNEPSGEDRRVFLLLLLVMVFWLSIFSRVFTAHTLYLQHASSEELIFTKTNTNSRTLCTRRCCVVARLAQITQLEEFHCFSPGTAPGWWVFSTLPEADQSSVCSDLTLKLNILNLQSPPWIKNLWCRCWNWIFTMFFRCIHPPSEWAANHQHRWL